MLRSRRMNFILNPKSSSSFNLQLLIINDILRSQSLKKKPAFHTVSFSKCWRNIQEKYRLEFTERIPRRKCAAKIPKFQLKEENQSWIIFHSNAKPQKSKLKMSHNFWESLWDLTLLIMHIIFFIEKRHFMILTKCLTEYTGWAYFSLNPILTSFKSSKIVFLSLVKIYSITDKV